LNSVSKNFHRPFGVALSRVVLVPTAAGDFGEADLAVIKVKWAEYQAMAVLFPEEARNEFFALLRTAKSQSRKFRRGWCYRSIR
jgi:hypothetical protein